MTTRWVMASADSKFIADQLPDCCHIVTPQVNFSSSAFSAIRMYEQGYVIEGCGLGACLVFAERYGCQSDEIITSLDEAVYPWLKQSVACGVSRWDGLSNKSVYERCGMRGRGSGVERKEGAFID